MVNADGAINYADRKPKSPQVIWNAIRALQRGSRLVEEFKPLKLRKDQNDANTAICDLTEENKKVMVEYLKTVFSKEGICDPAAVEEVPQRHVQPHLDMEQSVHETRRAVMAMGTANLAAVQNSQRSTGKHFWATSCYSDTW